MIYTMTFCRWRPTNMTKLSGKKNPRYIKNNLKQLFSFFLEWSWKTKLKATDISVKSTISHRSCWCDGILAPNHWHNKSTKTPSWSETSEATVKPGLSGPHIKRIPSIKWTPAWVPKFSSHICCKIDLHSADTSVKRTLTPILSHFVVQNLQ